MGKRFGIRGRNINIASFVNMMKETVRHHSQLQHILLDAELSHEHSSSARIIRSSFRTGFQFAGDKQLYFLCGQLFLCERQRPKCGFKVSKVVVMAHAEEAQRTGPSSQFAFKSCGKRTVVSLEQILVEAVMHRDYLGR